MFRPHQRRLFALGTVLALAGCGSRSDVTNTAPSQEELERFLAENPEYNSPPEAASEGSGDSSQDPLELGR